MTRGLLFSRIGKTAVGRRPPPQHAFHMNRKNKRRPPVSAPAIVGAAGLVVVLYVFLSLWQFSVLDSAYHYKSQSGGIGMSLPTSNNLRGFPGGRTADVATPTEVDAAAETWSHPLIHIVNTRFMQEQAHLINLAEARLELFERFCLPTMIRQSVYGFTDFEPSPNATAANWQQQQQQFQEEEGQRQEGSTDQDEQSSEEGDDGSFTDPPFLWIIKVDPNLDPATLSTMIDLVKDHREIILLGSNTNFGIGIKGGGWRGGQAGADVLETAAAGRLYNGDLDLVRRAHEARRERIVLETRLDADDGLNSLYLERLQRDALEDLYSGFDEDEEDSDDAQSVTRISIDSDQRNAIGSRGQFPPGMARWLYWCPLNHVAWDPNPPGENPRTNPNATSYGTFIPWKSPKACITAGLTVGASVGLAENDIPRFPHQSVVERIRYGPNATLYSSSNGNTLHKATNAANDTESDTGHCGLFNRTACLRMVEHPKMGALRSRTPTSAGMKGVVTQENNKPQAHIMMEQRAKDPKTRASMWKVLSHYFAITEDVATEMNNYVQQHFVDIVGDNLRGQCTRGHSCKISSKEELQRLLDVASEGKIGGVGTMNVAEEVDLDLEV
eukprot:CAMPEP_0178621498 /NCGR_PEP_ID=MMETSP0698-20121128/5844_1 /TAXON_ID=265572 /ORGANISM="Extubocellulus spinifer, Strain CCMP396" /LENGTH=611 /DNA_ID=CAMNT_0020260533 /DNA_START=239 /DNA_END=2071 /DNA_ORIENTATION=+